MKSNYKQLGQFIRQVDVRNSEGKEEIYLVFLFKRNLFHLLQIQLERILRNIKL